MYAYLSLVFYIITAYRAIYRQKLTVEEALSALSDLRTEHDEVNIFLVSIEESTRGISR